MRYGKADMLVAEYARALAEWRQRGQREKEERLERSFAALEVKVHALREKRARYEQYQALRGMQPLQGAQQQGMLPPAQGECSSFPSILIGG